MRHGYDSGTTRLLHDLAVTGRMQAERPSATERVEALLGAELAGVLRTTLVGASTPAGGAQPRRAA